MNSFKIFLVILVIILTTQTALFSFSFMEDEKLVSIVVDTNITVDSAASMFINDFKMLTGKNMIKTT